MKRAKTILLYNNKGGVGKTTLEGISAYQMANMGYKTLVIDFDPQANMTSLFEKTYLTEFHSSQSLEASLNNEDISNSICKATDYLDIVPTNWSLTEWSTRADKLAVQKRYNILRNAIEPVRNQYDYIFIDVPPTLANYSINAVFAADAIGIVLMTQQTSYESALKTIVMLNNFRKRYGIDFNFLGVILYLTINAKVDREVKNQAIHQFDKYLFKNRIMRQERVKGFTAHGITDTTFWDKRAIGMYKQVTNELLKRLEDD